MDETILVVKLQDFIAAIYNANRIINIENSGFGILFKDFFRQHERYIPTLEEFFSLQLKNDVVRLSSSRANDICQDGVLRYYSTLDWFWVIRTDFNQIDNDQINIKFSYSRNKASSSLAYILGNDFYIRYLKDLIEELQTVNN